MPYPPASEPLEKITINLYAKDVERLKICYGRGYQQKIREMVRAACDTARDQFADLEGDLEE